MINSFANRNNVYQHSTINADSFDKRRFNELLHMSKGLQEVKEEGQEIPQFDQLMGDIWSSFFKNKPQLKDKEEINSELATNHQLMERVLNDDFFQETHEYTKLDDLHSALSTVGFSNKVLNWIQNQNNSSKDLKRSYENLLNQQRKDKNSKKYQNALQEYTDQMHQFIENDSEEFSQMLQESIKESKKTEKNLKDLVGGINAGSGSSDLKEVPLRNQFELAEYLKNNHKLKNIAQWAGRFKAIARSKQKSMSKESLSRSGITIGNDIDRILPNEMLNLSNPVTKNEFLKRFVEGQTLQYANKGKQTLGKGPIIACLDQSGSMDKLDNQSKGFVLALMSIAKRQRRDFALIRFSDYAKVKKYPKGNISTDEMVVMCRQFINGGTNFLHPLQHSLDLLKKDRFKDGDIIFITDGHAPLSNDFLEQFKKEKKQLNFSVLSLLIGSSSNSNTISKFSDEIHHSKDFNDSSAHELFKI